MKSIKQRISKKLTLAKNWKWLLMAFGLILLIVNILVVYPGFLTADSISQLSQALNTPTLNDWHPPAMTVLWWFLLKIPPHVVGSMVAFQLTLLWASLVGLAVYVYDQTKSRKLSLLPLIFGLLPIVINISGAIWKDQQLAFSLLAAMVLILYVRQKKLSVKLRVVLLVLAMILMVYATAVRYNSWPAIIPLLFMLGLPGQRLRYRIMLAGIVLIAALSVGPLINAVEPVKSTNPAGSIMLDDVVHLYPVSELQHQAISAPLKNVLIALEEKCNPKYGGVDYTWGCANGAQRNILFGSGYPGLKHLYIKGIIFHPLRYIKFRTTTFVQFLNPSPAVDLPTVWLAAEQPNNYGVSFTPNPVTHFLGGYVHFTFSNFGFIYKAYVWLVASLAVVIVAFKKRLSYRHATLSLALGASSTLYIIGYWPLVIGDDYRYIYWSVFSTSLAGLLLLIDKFTASRRGQRSAT